MPKPDYTYIHDALKLSRGEQYWLAHFNWLKDCGYLLRPRYDPDHTPSWLQDLDTRPDRRKEDTIRIYRSHIIDAVRISDGKKVYLKKIYHKEHPHEVPIHLRLSLMKDPRNHCVPLLEFLEPELEGDDDVWILVMPLLSRYNDPPFNTFGEVVEFLRQIFEGVQFLHRNRVAHRDINALNIMVDASPLCHEEFHPILQKFDPEYKDLVKKCTRTRHPVRYYIIDFGLSRGYHPEEFSPREMPILGIDKTVPEFLLGIIYTFKHWKVTLRNIRKGNKPIPYVESTECQWLNGMSY